MRNRPISKQKRIKATAMRRFTLLCGFHFLNASRFAAEFANVIQLRAPHASGADDLDLVDDLRVKRKDSFNAVPERHLANGECCARSAVLLSNADAFKDLDAFLIAFLDLHVDLD